MFCHRGYYLHQATFAVTDSMIFARPLNKIVYILLLMEHEHQCELLNRSIGIDSTHAVFMSAEDNILTCLLSISKLLLFRNAYRTQSNIFDGTFLQKSSIRDTQQLILNTPLHFLLFP